MKQDSDDKQPEDLVQRLVAGTVSAGVGGSLLMTVLFEKYRNGILLALLAAVIVVVVMGGVYRYSRKRKYRRLADAFGKEVTRQFDFQSTASSDYDQKARLEEMKR